MFWIVAIIIVACIATSLDSAVGKIVCGSAVVAVGLLILSWITGFGSFIALAKACAVIIIVMIVGSILYAMFK